MYAQVSRFRPMTVVIAALWFASPSAQAAESAFPQSGESKPCQSTPAPVTAQPTAPSANNEKFRQLRTQCETEVPSGKASGDVCVEAAALLVGRRSPR